MLLDPGGLAASGPPGMPSPRAWPVGSAASSLTPANGPCLSLRVGVRGSSNGQEAGPGPGHRGRGEDQGRLSWVLPPLGKLDLGGAAAREGPRVRLLRMGVQGGLPACRWLQLADS